MTWTDPRTLPVALYVRAGPPTDRYAWNADEYRMTAVPLLVNADGTPQNPDADDPRGLDNLTVSAQNTPTNAGPAYGADVDYRGYMILDARRIDHMARTLRRIRAHLARVETRYGPPEDAAAYALRVADAINARAFVLDAPERDSDTTYRADNYRTTDAAGAAHYIRRAEADWRAAHPATSAT